MRYYILALPILALSACSFIEQPHVGYNSGANSGHYTQGCSTGACAPGQSYSVANTPNSGVNPSHWPDQQLVSNYEGDSSYGQGPVHINPTGYGHNGYGSQQFPAYGQLPRLRGQQGGHFYGTLGGVMYDKDIDSFGIEGRLGYQGGRHWGVEMETSLGIVDDSKSNVKVIEGTNTPVTYNSDVSADYNVAAFAIGRLPIGNRFSVHARGGYDFRSLTFKESIFVHDELFDSAEESINLDGLAYGVGAEYALSPRSGLRLDYTEYKGGGGLGTESISASFTRKF